MSNETQSSDNGDARARTAGFVDARSRREFWILASASLLSSITITHSTLVAVALARSGYALEQIGVLLAVALANFAKQFL